MDREPAPERETISVSKFKATCLAVLRRVRETGKPVVVTRFGEPVAEIVPPSATAAGEAWLGALAGRGEVVGDLVEPAAPPEAWEVLGR